MQFQRALEGSDAFDRIKHFACTRYADSHQAILRHFLPVQYLLLDETHWLASCGVRNANGQALFLEQYLDGDIDVILSKRLGRDVQRQQIVEVGNLAGEAGGSRLMILAVTRLLALSGVDYVVFTATRELQSAFSRLGLEPWFLAQANPNRLAEGAGDWGRYYDTHPAVFAGSVQEGWQAIQQQPVLMRILGAMGQEINDVV
ncbi:thermostable hemolysin [Gallaecimonas mangrovi]|uniref:thermostable hemolysin n=1 Tax=Gallaecimonas mangrovi TaxID=2291597 RepID=UPI001866BD4E|nr:thermostable hemolysin [Gallaecimonas mangrovi]